MGSDLGFLRMNRGIHIPYQPARSTYLFISMTQQHAAIGTLVFRIGVGEMAANIPQARSTQDGIGNGMQQGIGIRMPHQAMRMRDGDTAQNQGSAFAQHMHIKTLSYANRHAHNHFSISSKSSGQVTLKFRAEPKINKGRLPANSMALASSVTAKPCSLATCKASRKAWAGNSWGVCASHSPSLSTVSCTATGSVGVARLTVSDRKSTRLN